MAGIAGAWLTHRPSVRGRTNWARRTHPLLEFTSTTALDTKIPIPRYQGPCSGHQACIHSLSRTRVSKSAAEAQTQRFKVVYRRYQDLYGRQYCEYEQYRYSTTMGTTDRLYTPISHPCVNPTERSFERAAVCESCKPKGGEIHHGFTVWKLDPIGPD